MSEVGVAGENSEMKQVGPQTGLPANLGSWLARGQEWEHAYRLTVERFEDGRWNYGEKYQTSSKWIPTKGFLDVYRQRLR